MVYRKKMPPMEVIKKRYEIVDGRLFYKKNAYHCWARHKGREVRTRTSGGYRRASFIQYGNYAMHRVLWYLATGEQPEIVDHKDGDTLNNCLSNLQSVSSAENIRKARRRKNNTSGRVGVHWNRAVSKWTAQIAIDRKNMYIGSFEEFEDACMARRQAEDDLFGLYVPIDR